MAWVLSCARWGVQVCTKLKCSAEQFKWLWAIRSIVEKIMLRECRTVADRFVDYCKRAAKEGANQMVRTYLPGTSPTTFRLYTQQHQTLQMCNTCDASPRSYREKSKEGGRGGIYSMTE